MPAYNLVSENLPGGLAKHPDLDVPWVLKEGGIPGSWVRSAFGKAQWFIKS